MATAETVDDHLDAVIANVPGAIYRCRLDADWTMEFISEEIARLTGYPAADFIGSSARTFASVLHPDDRALVEAAVSHAVEQGAPFCPEYRIVRRDGSVVWVLERGRASAPGPDGLSRLDGVIFDITERKVLEEELGRALADEAAAEERLRLARDLHDAVGHALSIGTIQAVAARAVLHRDRDAADRALGVIEESLREALDEMRAMVGKLHRPDVESTATFDLEDVVASGRRAGLEVDYVVTGEPRVLPGAVEVSLYRTLQESLTNCAKYAAGSLVTVVLRHGEDEVVLTVTDDGTGCAAQDGAPGGGGHGLAGIRERAASLGGSCRSGPTAAGEFRVEVRFPA